MSSDGDDPSERQIIIAQANPKVSHNTNAAPPQEEDETSFNEDEEEESDEEEDPENDDDEEEEEDDDDDDDADDEEDSDNSDEDSSSEQEESAKKIVTEDGREISEYELMRLERIRRNKERLAQLGLQGQNGAGVLGGQKRPKKKVSRPKPEVGRRSSLSRSSKKKITSYATSLPSVREMLKGQTQVIKQPKQPKPKKVRSERMDKVIHTEFRRLQSQKTHALRQAGRDNRAAAKETRFWKNFVEASKRKELREKQRQQGPPQSAPKEEEKLILGGKTARQALKEIEERMEEIEQAVEEYDEKYEAEARLRQRHLERFEMDERMKNIEAFERYPKTLKETTALLSSILLERAPKDPPPPRRSKRAGEEDEKTEQPATKKAKAETKDDEESWSEQAPISAVSLPTAEEEANSPSGTPVKTPAGGKKRQRLLRNVGGWVSPDFAAKLSRSWLERDNPAQKFDLATFVPQIGDTVLYYPRGHYEFVSEYPDFLGKKMRQVTRVPLWERLGSTKEGEDDQRAKIRKWCPEEWATSIADGTEGGRYPILCTVQATCAEFPPDPSKKVIKNKEGVDGETIKKVFFKKSKSSGDVGKRDAPKLRLAVTLKPMSPVLPGMGLDLPPIFSVVLFPAKKRPFLIPFSWAYSLNHSLAFGATVVERSDPDSLMRISKVDTLTSLPNEGRVSEEKVGSVLGLLGDTKSRKQKLAEVLSDDPRQLPLCDALVALTTLEKFAKNDVTYISSTNSSDFMDLVCETLPVWNSLTVTSKDVYDRKKRVTMTVSPWDVAISQKTLFLNEATPDRIAEFPSDRDESLRMKIEAVIEEVIRDHFSASLFVDPITEEIAPSYFCAVPVGMCMSRIRKRLKGSTKSKGCFYRSVGAVLNDVTGIVENCLLYNSPESEVVEAAADVSNILKDGITRVVRDYNKQMTAVQKADEDRRRQVLQLFGTGTEASNKVAVSVCRIRKPFKQLVFSDWLQQYTNKPNTGWVPQAGDDVEYSKSLHKSFVEGHHSGLELDQCEVLPVLGNTTREKASASIGKEVHGDDWVAGRVAWTKAVFPRHSTKKDIENSAFSKNSTLLAVGIHFGDENSESSTLHVVYWRPCTFNVEKADAPEIECSACGLSFNCSFLRKSTETSDLADSEAKSIADCFSLLKKRILDGVAPSHIDPELTKSSIKQGYDAPSSRQGLQSLPSFGSLFNAVGDTGHGTRKVGERFKAPPPMLNESGYLAHWMSQNQKSSKACIPKQYETVSPWPKMCLELIRLRLLNGFYRSRMAIENDLIEAYSSTCLLMISEAASQKHAPLSVKKVAKLLSSWKGQDVKDDGLAPVCGSEEKRVWDWAKKFRPIRDLYAAALTAVSDTEKFERLNGLHMKVEPVFYSEVPDSSKETQNAVQINAREKLRLILDAIKRDPLAEEFYKKSDSLRPKLSVLCDRKKIEYTKFMTTIKRAVATKDDKEIKVKILCKGIEVHVEREVPRKTAYALANIDESEVKVKVIADGEEICVADTSRFGESADIREVISDYISIGQRDLDASETLARFLYGRPGRFSVCARCVAFKRNMFTCRVRRAHARPDFDWHKMFENIDSIDSLLKAMKTGTWASESQCDAQADGTQNDTRTTETTDTHDGKAVETQDDRCQDVQNPASSKGSASHKELSKNIIKESDLPKGRRSTRSTASNANDDASGGESRSETRAYGTRSRRSTRIEDVEEVEVTSSTPRETEANFAAPVDSQKTPKSKNDAENSQEDSGSVPSVNPESCLAKAEAAFALSKIVLEEAEKFAEAPPRLSKEFIEAAVPVDSNDGHFIYCIICGLSGDLLCCDGCPNVMHRRCIGLEAVPENEWFCEECNMKKAESLEPEDRDAENKSNEEKLPFGRFNFDQERADRLTEMVRELHTLRPHNPSKREKKKSKKGRDSQNGDSIDPSDPLNVLPETARKFICSMGIFNYSDFLATRTYVIADKFTKWRKENRLPELKGSGPTAYASQWKSRCRDAAATSGLAIPEEDEGVIWKDDGESESGGSYSEGKKRRRKRKAPGNSAGRSRPRKQIENPLDVLSRLNKEFLSSIGIEDPDAFLEMRTTDLATRYVRWRKEKSLPKLKSNGETATISAWKTMVRNAEVTPSNGSTRAISTPPKAKRPKLNEAAITPPTPRVDTAAGRAERAKKRKERFSVEVFTSGGGKDKKWIVDESEDWPPHENPLDALTETAKSFLSDEGINRAEDFLAFRSGEAADRLGVWRKKKGMSRLKGSGEGATIGAWKTTVRKAVASLERYREHLKNNPTDDTSSQADSRQGRTSKTGTNGPCGGRRSSRARKTDSIHVLEVVEAPRRRRRSRHQDDESADVGAEKAGKKVEASAVAVAKELATGQMEDAKPQKRSRRSRV